MARAQDWMIYGATGYTGTQIARAAQRAGMQPILSGRDETKVAALADELGLRHRAFGLDHPRLDGIGLVLHCAGPFSKTSRPMVDACLAAQASYYDITGEIDVFEEVFTRDAEAKARGVTLLPGVGFDVVPSDCLAAMLKEALPSATSLELAFRGASQVSQGTLKSMLEGLPQGARVRVDGKLINVPWGDSIVAVRFADKTIPCMPIPWGDVSTAYHSTGIPNIRVYGPARPRTVLLLKYGAPALRVLSHPGVSRLAQRLVDRFVPRPEAKESSRPMRLWGRVRNGSSGARVAWLETPEAYAFTADSSLAAVRRWLDGPLPAGAVTPSKAFGPTFVLDLPGVRLTGPQPEAD